MNLIFFFLLASTNPAHALDPRIIGGAAAIAIPVGVDTLNWGLVPERDHALAWHLVPVAGPVIGLRATARMPCDDPLHGCTMQRGMFTIMDTLALASEVAGVTMMLIAASDRSGRVGIEVTEQRAMLRLTRQW